MSRAPRILGVILAGGAARRMGGGDKGLLPLGDGCLLDWVIARFAPQVERLAINANGDAARFERFDLPVLPDGQTELLGPLAGILAGLDWAKAEGADGIVTAAADTPFFPRTLARDLLRAAGPHGLALAGTDAEDEILRHPTFGLWPVSLGDDLRDALERGTRKIVVWTDRHEPGLAVWPERDQPFFNVNTPQDLQTAQRRAAAMV